MKTEYYLVPESTIEAFADANGLTMEVHERASEWVQMRHIGPLRRYYADFPNAEIKTATGMLLSSPGDGPTPALAIADYARKISERLLVINAYQPTRREIKVPRLLPPPHPGEQS